MASYTALTVVSGTVITSAWGNNVRDSSIITATSSTRPGTPTEWMLVGETDTDGLVGHTGSSWVYLLEHSWHDLSNVGTTPVQFGGITWSNVTIQELRWKWTNGMVDVFVKASAGSGTTGTTGLIYMDGITMPSPSINGIAAGSFHYYASSPNLNYAGTVSVGNNAGTPRFTFVVTGSNNGLGASPQFTQGSSDVLLFHARYRAS